MRNIEPDHVANAQLRPSRQSACTHADPSSSSAPNAPAQLSARPRPADSAAPVSAARVKSRIALAHPDNRLLRPPAPTAHKPTHAAPAPAPISSSAQSDCSPEFSPAPSRYDAHVVGQIAARPQNNLDRIAEPRRRKLLRHNVVPRGPSTRKQNRRTLRTAPSAASLRVTSTALCRNARIEASSSSTPSYISTPHSAIDLLHRAIAASTALQLLLIAHAGAPAHHAEFKQHLQPLLPLPAKNAPNCSTCSAESTRQ